MLDIKDKIFKMLEEKDLIVKIYHKLNFSNNIVTQVKKANKMVGLIRRFYTHLDSTSSCCFFKFLSQTTFRIMFQSGIRLRP